MPRKPIFTLLRKIYRREAEESERRVDVSVPSVVEFFERSGSIDGRVATGPLRRTQRGVGSVRGGGRVAALGLADEPGAEVPVSPTRKRHGEQIALR